MSWDWNKILEPIRFRESNNPNGDNDKRNPFENDYTRIILSPHFRRLQDKAQVFPYDDSDFVRTRLTHSLEVSTFGRSIGLTVEDHLIKTGKLSEGKRGHISSLLATAGLIHDIGNPPFGHFGERCIQDFFHNFFQHPNPCLTTRQKRDFLYFDGNPQTFRLLRKLGPSIDEFSYNLTFPTLATIIKYPISSENNDEKNRKFGYFQSESEDFKEISDRLGLENKRHPLVSLLEAADDIAYSVSDIEDGVKKGIITEELLRDSITSSDKLTKDEKEELSSWLYYISKKLENIYLKHPSRFILIAQRFRINCQRKMIKDICDTFIEKIDKDPDQNFDNELIQYSKSATLRKFLKNLAIHNFNHDSVLKRELAGKAALDFHLKSFTNAILNFDPEDTLSDKKSADARLYNLISKNYEYIIKKNEPKLDSTYRKLLLITDFISGMTDSYALKLFHELSGIAPY